MANRYFHLSWSLHLIIRPRFWIFFLLSFTTQWQKTICLSSEKQLSIKKVLMFDVGSRVNFCLSTIEFPSTYWKTYAPWSFVFEACKPWRHRWSSWCDCHLHHDSLTEVEFGAWKWQQNPSTDSMLLLAKKRLFKLGSLIGDKCLRMRLALQSLICICSAAISEWVERAS